MMGRFSDLRILGAVAGSQQTFLLSPTPIPANTRGGDQKKFTVEIHSLLGLQDQLLTLSTILSEVTLAFEKI